MRTVKIKMEYPEEVEMTLQSTPEGANAAEIQGKYQGELPESLGITEDEDNLVLEVDVETGRILNWTPPSSESLAETFNLKKAA